MIMGVIDVGSSMADGLNGGSKLSIASSFYSSYVLQRMVASKTVEFGLVTYGSDETNNFLNTNQGGYESVEEVVPMEKPDITSIQYIANIKPGSGRGDLIDGIVVGQDILNRTNVKKAFNKILLLITDGETEVEGVEDLETIVGNMKSIVNFSLYIAMVGKVTPTSSVIKRENAKLLQSLVESIDGKFAEMEDPRDGFYLLAGGAGLGTKPQLLKTVLELAPQVGSASSYQAITQSSSHPMVYRYLYLYLYLYLFYSPLGEDSLCVLEQNLQGQGPHSEESRLACRSYSRQRQFR